MGGAASKEHGAADDSGYYVSLEITDGKDVDDDQIDVPVKTSGEVVVDVAVDNGGNGGGEHDHQGNLNKEIKEEEIQNSDEEEEYKKKIHASDEDEEDEDEEKNKQIQEAASHTHASDEDEGKVRGSCFSWLLSAIKAGQGRELEGADGSNNTSTPRSDNMARRVHSLEQKVEELKTDVAQLKESVENQPSESESERVQPSEIELKEEQKAIEDEEEALGNTLDGLLEKCIITVASFFIAFHELLANSQQPTNDLLKFLLLGILIVIIWISSTVLLGIWWFKMQGIEEKLKSLDKKQSALTTKARSQKIQGIRPQLKLSTFKRNSYKSIVIFLGIFATVASVYFGAITYTLWSAPVKVSLLPTM